MTQTTIPITNEILANLRPEKLAQGIDLALRTGNYDYTLHSEKYLGGVVLVPNNEDENVILVYFNKLSNSVVVKPIEWDYNDQEWTGETLSKGVSVYLFNNAAAMSTTLQSAINLAQRRAA